jgi:hypothetical protein
LLAQCEVNACSYEEIAQLVDATPDAVRGRITGRAVPDIAGVDTGLVDCGVRLELRILLDHRHQAAAV